jgi:hypothetical protein
MELLPLELGLGLGLRLLFELLFELETAFSESGRVGEVAPSGFVGGSGG